MGWKMKGNQLCRAKQRHRPKYPLFGVVWILRLANIYTRAGTTSKSAVILCTESYLCDNLYILGKETEPCEVWTPLAYFALQSVESAMRECISFSGLPSETKTRVWLLAEAVYMEHLGVIKKLLDVGIIKDRYPLSKSNAGGGYLDSVPWTDSDLPCLVCRCLSCHRK